MQKRGRSSFPLSQATETSVIRTLRLVWNSSFEACAQNKCVWPQTSRDQGKVEGLTGRTDGSSQEEETVP
jgi:hypothetical protein